MKSKILKAALLASAALAMGAMATSTQAKSYDYNFGTPYGGEYCDGLTLTSSDKIIYSGLHSGTCEGSSQYAGGFAGSEKKTAKGINISTTDAFLPGYAITFLVDTKAVTWAVYGNLGDGFEFLNSGPLIVDSPKNKHLGKSSVYKNLKAVKPVSAE
jgi:hypothetical protein